MPAVLLSPPFAQFFDDNGNPLAGGKVYTYQAGTTTNKATYSDASGNTPVTNPITLDAAGRPLTGNGAIWGDGSYNLRLTSADGLYDKTLPNVTTFINNTTGGQTLTNTTLNNPTISGGTADNIVIGNGIANTGAFTSITASQGLTVGNAAIASSTTLDWYQEGNFTPVLVGTTAAGVGTYGTQFGQYTRIGNRVDFRIVLTWTAHTGTGNGQITGLPFANASFTTPVAVYNFGYATAASTFLVVSCDPNATTLTLSQETIQTGVIGAAAIDTSASLWLQGTYFVST